MLANIKTLLDNDGNQILPRTRSTAITMSDGVTMLDDAIANVSAPDLTGANIDIVDSGNYYTGTDAETVLQEVGADIAAIENTLANLSADASDIVVTPVNNISSTNVQDALAELDGEKMGLNGGAIVGDVNITGNNYVTGNIKVTGNSQSTEFIQGTTGLTLNSSLYGGSYRLPRVYVQTSETAPGTMQDGDLLFVYTA